MSTTPQLRRNGSFWYEPPQRLSHELVLKLNDEDNFSFTQSMKSQCPSTCHSDDSGIEPTLALSPISPLAEDTDSEDGFSNYCSPDNSFQDRYYGSPPARDVSSTKSSSLDGLHASPTGSCKGNIRARAKTTRPFWDKNKKASDNRFHLLSYEQIGRLYRILTEPVKIHSRHIGYPCVEMELRQLFLAVRKNLHALDVPVKDMRINGGVASYIIGLETTPKYNDVDILISVDLSSNSSTIQKVKTAVLDALMQFIPEESRENVSNRNTPPSLRCAGSCSVPGSDYHNADFPYQPRYSDQSLLTGATRPTVMFSRENMNSYCCDRPSAESTLAFLDTTTSCLVTGAPGTEGENPCFKSASVVYGSNLSLHQYNCPLHVVGEPGVHNHLLRIPPQPGSLSASSMRESYVYKQFRKFSTHEADCWSLLSLGVPEADSKVIEFKFVDRMRRQFEFTVDSFQIHLDSILSFIECHPPDALNANFYPTVNVECVAGSFSEALYHLTNKLIITREPEMIRGGGLLKYCRLISNGYIAPDGIDVCSLERYMSSRFFIDFQNLESQKLKIESFLHNHFAPHEIEEKIDFLEIFYRVVSGSTVCLMSHERYQTLTLTNNLLQHLERQLMAEKPSFCLTDFIESRNLTLDKIYVGKHLFPPVVFASNYACSCHHSDMHQSIMGTGQPAETFQQYASQGVFSHNRFGSNQTNLKDIDGSALERKTMANAAHINTDGKVILED